LGSVVVVVHGQKLIGDFCFQLDFYGNRLLDGLIQPNWIQNGQSLFYVRSNLLLEMVQEGGFPLGTVFTHTRKRQCCPKSSHKPAHQLIRFLSDAI